MLDTSQREGGHRGHLLHLRPFLCREAVEVLGFTVVSVALDQFPDPVELRFGDIELQRHLLGEGIGFPLVAELATDLHAQLSDPLADQLVEELSLSCSGADGVVDDCSRASLLRRLVAPDRNAAVVQPGKVVAPAARQVACALVVKWLP